MNKIQKLTAQQVLKLNSKSKHLKPQFYEDIQKVNQRVPQVMSRQATVNIGVIGHVSHGKSSIIQSITGSKTGKYKQEIKQNMTIKLGFSNAKIYKCRQCPSPQCYKSFPSDCPDMVKCPNNNCPETLQLVKHVSFVDCPGHHKFMSAMMTGVAIMDSVMLVIAANTQCPQPQTREHMIAIQSMSLNNNIILQNKLDLVFHDRQKVKKNYKQIKNFIKGSSCQRAPIIPISAQLNYNIDAVLEAICQLPEPQRKFDAPARMLIVRSFDINNPGKNIQDLKGGVVGGAILQGVLSVGMIVQIRPGICTKDQQGNIKVTPVFSKIVSLKAEKNSLVYALPGGLIGAELLVDPSLTRKNKMVGNLLGSPESLPNVYIQITIKIYLMKRLLEGSTEKQQENKDLKIKKIQKGEILKFYLLVANTIGEVEQVVDDIIRVKLRSPICCDIGEKLSFCRKYQKNFRLIGYGKIKKGLAALIQQ